MLVGTAVQNIKTSQGGIHDRDRATSRVETCDRCTAALALALAGVRNPRPAAAAEFTMKFGTATFNESQHQYIKFYKEALEKASGGRIEVGIYPRSELGPIPRMIDGLQLGTIEAYIGPADFYVGVDPRFGVLSTPMLFKNNDHASATVLDPALNEHHPQSGRARRASSVSAPSASAPRTMRPSRRSCGCRISPARSCASTPPPWNARR